MGCLMMKGGHGQTNQSHDINWGALDHASHAPQLMSCNYYVYAVCVLETKVLVPKVQLRTAVLA